MSQNEMPQAANLRQSNNQSAKVNNSNAEENSSRRYLFGVSCPEITTDDLSMRELCPDYLWYKEKQMADAYLISLGYPPVTSREDQIRIAKHKMMWCNL